jgi:hypothetical protein
VGNFPSKFCFVKKLFSGFGLFLEFGSSTGQKGRIGNTAKTYRLLQNVSRSHYGNHANGPAFSLSINRTCSKVDYDKVQ